MENIITIAILILGWFSFRKVKIYLKKKAQKKHQRALREYEKTRNAYFYEERKMVIDHYRNKILSGDISKADALNDVFMLLKLNNGGGNEWKNEFKQFEQEVEKLPSITLK